MCGGASDTQASEQRLTSELRDHLHVGRTHRKPDHRNQHMEGVSGPRTMDDDRWKSSVRLPSCRGRGLSHRPLFDAFHSTKELS